MDFGIKKKKINIINEYVVLVCREICALFLFDKNLPTFLEFPLTSLLTLCYHIRCTIVVLCVHSAVYNCGKAQFRPHYLVVRTDFYLGRNALK